MAQTGYTPILIYSSTTASQAPAAGNLTNSTLGSELAINITDGKLFYKDNANAVQVIAWKVTPTTAGGTGLTSYTAGDTLYYAAGTTLSKLAIGASKTIMTSSGTAPQWSASLDTSQGGTGLTTYTAGDLIYYATGTTFTKLGIGASGRWLGSSGTAPQWNAPAALTKTDDTNVTLTLGGSATTALLNAASLTLGWTGTLAVSRGGTGASSAGITAFNNITGYTATGATGTTSTNLVFSTSPSITTPTLVGDVTLSTGNITQGTAAKGLNYSANSTAAGKTSTLLNWYEEGTFTPVLLGTTTNPTVTYSIQRGRYTRVGRLVTIECYVAWSAISGGSGNIAIGGFPYTIDSSTGASGGGSVSYLDGFTLTVGRTSVGLLANANTTYATPMCMGSGVSTQYVPVSSVAAGLIIFTLTYSV